MIVDDHAGLEDRLLAALPRLDVVVGFAGDVDLDREPRALRLVRRHARLQGEAGPIHARDARSVTVRHSGEAVQARTSVGRAGQGGRAGDNQGG